MRSLIQFLSIAGILVVGAAPARAADWGDLTGTFVYNGKAPEVSLITPTKDVAFCGRQRIPDESLVVGSDSGVKNIVVFVYDNNPPIHADYATTAKDKVKLDNQNCRYEPHVVLLRTSQTLVIGNPDAVGHNTKIDCFTNAAINPLIPAGGTLEQPFPAPERLPVPVSCNIHPWMSAKLVVKDHPYMALTDESGKFTIKNLPVGDWTFQFWHEKAGYVQQVEVNGKKQTWSRGRHKIAINKTGTDLGKIKLDPSIFAK